MNADGDANGDGEISGLEDDVVNGDEVRLAARVDVNLFLLLERGPWRATYLSFDKITSSLLSRKSCTDVSDVSVI